MGRPRLGFGPHPAERLEPDPACLINGTFWLPRRPAACGRRRCGSRHGEPPSIQRAAAVDIRTDTIYGCDCSIAIGPGKLEELWPDGLVIVGESKSVAGDRYNRWRTPGKRGFSIRIARRKRGADAWLSSVAGPKADLRGSAINIRFRV